MAVPEGQQDGSRPSGHGAQAPGAHDSTDHARNGEVIVMFFAALASGQPFMMQYVKELEMTDEQKAVAYGIATDAQKAMAKRQRRFVVLRRPYYPNMEEMTAAMNWLAERGFGKAPKTVQIEGSVTAGFKMVFRRWAPGTDPASLPLAEMPKQIVSSSKIPDFPAPPGKSGPKDGAR